MSTLNICTWNLCLGLTNKKDIVTRTLSQNNISICCLQETEVPNDYPEGLLSCNGYRIELEKCSTKRRAGIFLCQDIDYTRRIDLEKEDCHIVIIDVNMEVKIRIINVYRSFHPPGGVSVNTFFDHQLTVIKNALCKNCYILGDFNLEGGINLSSDYYNRSLLNTLQNFVTESNLTQVVDFNTWSRTINGQKKESMLDHAYLTNIENLNAVYFDTPIFGDHVLVILNLAIQMKQKSKTCALKCCWRDYSPANLTSFTTQDSC